MINVESNVTKEILTAVAVDPCLVCNHNDKSSLEILISSSS